MKKSLIVIASALLLAVAGTSASRLRYDSTVFGDSGDPSGGYKPQAVQVEYPPCVPGVREDRCIQLYERGVRRGYQRWLAMHGRGDTRYASARSYPVCRGRKDDECRQVNGRLRHRAGTVQQARQVRTRAPQQAVARPVRYAPAPQRPMLQRTSAPSPRGGGMSTPGI